MALPHRTARIAGVCPPGRARRRWRQQGALERRLHRCTQRRGGRHRQPGRTAVGLWLVDHQRHRHRPSWRAAPALRPADAECDGHADTGQPKRQQRHAEHRCLCGRDGRHDRRHAQCRGSSRRRGQGLAQLQPNRRHHLRPEDHRQHQSQPARHR